MLLGRPAQTRKKTFKDSQEGRVSCSYAAPLMYYRLVLYRMRIAMSSGRRIACENLRVARWCSLYTYGIVVNGFALVGLRKVYLNESSET